MIVPRLARPGAGVSGRTAHFMDSAEKVRMPEFRSMQQVVGNYRRTSLFDNLLPTPNGMGSSDYSRFKLGINKSAIGESTSTFERGLWLRTERPPPLYENG